MQTFRLNVRKGWSPVLSLLAARFCPLELETLIDPSDKIKGRLFAKVLLFSELKQTELRGEKHILKWNRNKYFFQMVYFAGTEDQYKNCKFLLSAASLSRFSKTNTYIISNKNYWVVRNAGFTRSRNTWKLTPIFSKLIKCF